MQLTKQLIGLVPLTLILLGLLSYNFMSAQWTGPSATAPGNNATAPINISNNYQAKLGDLGAVRMRAGEYCDASLLSCITINDTGLFSIWTLGGSLMVTGTSTARSFMYSSDVRLKHNIHDIHNPIALVRQLQGVTFNWNKDDSSTYGLIAQDVESVLPELVATNSEGFKTVAYGNIIPILIEAIKAQQKEIELLKIKTE